MRLPALPVAPRSGRIDVLHGMSVADPFRAFENENDLECQAWAEAQRIRTRAILDSLPLLAETEEFLRSVWQYPRKGLPVRRGKFNFIWHYDGIKAQGMLFVEEKGRKPRVLLDANLWSSDGTVAIGNWWPSPDGSLVAYTRHVAGSDWSSIHIADVLTGIDLPDVIENCRWGEIAWLGKGNAFLYTLPPADDPNRETVRIHTIGQSTELDPFVFVTPQPAPSFVWCLEFANGQGAACYASNGATNERGCWIVEPDGTTFHPLVPVGFTIFDVCHREGNVVYAITTYRAPFGRLVAVSISDPSPENWRDIVPGSSAALQQAVFVNKRWVLRYKRHGWDQFETRDFDGNDRQQIILPEAGLELGIAWLGQANPEDETILFSHGSLRRPPWDYRLNPSTGAVSLLRKSEALVDLSDCIIEQVFVPARDGVQVPLTLIHRPDMVKSGSAPTLLYSYGGYGQLSEHNFDYAVCTWVRAGGIYAIAGIRGGGEEGENWHKAAIRGNRQLSFNDFLDCSQWLIDNRYCSSATLGIKGGSNGGLLVAACMTQRPELFGGVLCNVPVADMLRFHLFTVGAGWISEYGSPDNPDDFKALLAYSPVHNVSKDIAYPPIMISTADHDDRVVPMHSFKFAATLQETLSPVVLLRLERNAGHWAGASTAQIISQTADQHAFLWTALTGGFRKSI